MTKSAQKRNAPAMKKKTGVRSGSTPLKRNTSVVSVEPRQRLVKDGILVSHVEYVGPLMSSETPTTFSIDKLFRLNPGYTVFPWLSAIARNYESYRFKKLHLVVQNFMSAMRDGVVNYCVDYDADDAAPANLQQMLSNKTAGSRPVGAPFTVKLDVAALNKVGKGKFVRQSDTETQDPLLHDSGIAYFNASVPSELNNSIVANIFLDYEVEFKTPQVKGTSTALELRKIATVQFASSPKSSTQPINKKNDGSGAYTTVTWGQMLNDLAGNLTSQYGLQALTYVGNYIMGGSGTNTGDFESIYSQAAQMIAITEITAEDFTVNADATGSKTEGVRFDFNQDGRFLIKIMVNAKLAATPSNSDLLDDSCTIITNADAAAAEVNYNGYTNDYGPATFMRVSYEIAVQVKAGQSLEIRQAVWVLNTSLADSPMLIDRLGFDFTPYTPEEFDYYLRLRNVFPSSFNSPWKCLKFERSNCYGVDMNYTEGVRYLNAVSTVYPAARKDLTAVEDLSSSTRQPVLNSLGQNRTGGGYRDHRV